MNRSSVVPSHLCNKVIQNCIGSDKFEIVNFKVKPFEDKEREYYKADCILEISAKISKEISRFRFFLKKCQTEYAPLNQLLDSIRGSEREIMFYEHFLPMLKNEIASYDVDYAPHFLGGELNHLIVLEDMSLRHFSLARKWNLHLLDRFHFCLALKALAKLHAGTWIYEEKLQESENRVLFNAADLLAEESAWQETGWGFRAIQSGVKGLKALLKLKGIDNDVAQKIDELVQKTLQIMQFQTEYRNVLGHGNLQTKNLLFKYDKDNNTPTDCVLINFDHAKYRPPAYDVLTLIFNGSNRVFRQHYFTYLLRFYFDALKNELAQNGLDIDQVQPFDVFQRTVNYLMPSIKLQTALQLQDCGAKPGFYKLIQRERQVYEAFLFEDKSPFVLELHKKDPIFKDIIEEALEELVETVQTPLVSRENCYAVLEEQLETTLYDLESFSLTPGENDNSLLNLVVLAEPKGDKNTYKYMVKCDSKGELIVENIVQE